MRGSLGSFLQFFDCIGYLIENIGGNYVSYENLALLSASMPLLCFFLLIRIPESPYYLQNSGKDVEAVRALRFFRDNVESSELKNEIEEMRVSRFSYGTCGIRGERLHPHVFFSKFLDICENYERKSWFRSVFVYKRKSEMRLLRRSFSIFPTGHRYQYTYVL